MKKRKFIICAALLLTAVACFGGYILNDYINSPKKNNAGISDDNIYRPYERDIGAIISDVLVKGVKRENKLVTTEVNLNCEILIDESYLDWGILKKRQSLKFYATALYAVDLENFAKSDIKLSEAEPIKITIYIEEPKLLSLALDSEKTAVGEVENGLLRFGDIKITPEDFKKIQLKASARMTEQLHNGEIKDLTEQNAKNSAEGFFVSVLENFIDDYEINVEFKR